MPARRAGAVGPRARPLPGAEGNVGSASCGLCSRGAFMTATPETILAALGTVNDPDLHRDLVSLGMIEDVVVEGGSVRFTLVLTTSACPLKAQIEDDCRRAVSAVAGVTDVQIRTTSRVRKPKDPTAERHVLEG